MSLWTSQFRNTAERGEWAEIRFLARAMEQRFRVSKPWGNSAPYDLMVERDGLVYRVQVKSTIHRVGPCSYGCRLPSEKRMLRLLKEVDFIAAYVIPADIWYIIPVGIVRKQKGSIWLSPWKRGARYDRYLESWYLLRQWRGGKKSAQPPQTSGETERKPMRKIRRKTRRPDTTATQTDSHQIAVTPR
ncbi:MAG: group I intron-associated PD-(D/E)XK endonuclease [Candidatus Sulfotelmatobacter sp.]|jgi:hypothetical protein